MSLTHPKLDLIWAPLSSFYFSAPLFWRGSMDNSGRWWSWGWGATSTLTLMAMGRMARFLMNTMLAFGGYPWTVVRVEDRARYLRALDCASIDLNMAPFAAFLAERVEWSVSPLPVKNAG
jgi:hypothetical protein